MTFPTLYATQFFNGTGTASVYSFSFAGVRPEVVGVAPYLAHADVKAVLITPATLLTPEVETALTVTFVGPNQVTLTPTPPVGVANVKIYRKTNADYPEVDFIGTAAVQESDLDINTRQLIFLAQEAHDRAALALYGIEALRAEFEAGDYGVTGDDIVAAFADHASNPDPHTGYVLESSKGAASGVASLGIDGKVPDAQLPASIPLTQKGAALGVATLDADGRVPSAQLPASIAGSLVFKGTWDASSGVAPSLTPAANEYWVVSIPGSTSLSGITSWSPPDWAVYNGTVWEKVDQSAAASVNFVDLADAPAAYTGHADKAIVVNSAEDGVVFVDRYIAPVGTVTNGYMFVPSNIATATFTADEVVVGDSLGGTTYRLSSFSESATLTTVGAGGRDSAAALGAGQGVAIYAIYNPTTADRALLVCLTSVSKGTVYSGPDMPAGYTASCLVSLWYLVSASTFRYGLQRGRDVSTVITAFINSSTGNPTTPTAVSIPVPAGAVRAWGVVGVESSGLDLYFGISATANYLGASVIAQPRAAAQLLGYYAADTWEVPLLTDGTVYWFTRTSTTPVRANLTGYSF